MTSTEVAWETLEKLDGLDLTDTLEPPFKKQRQALNLTSTSILERFIHVDPLANVPMKRIPNTVCGTMAKYQTG